MSEHARDPKTPQTSGSAARGTEAGGGESPDHLPEPDGDPRTGDESSGESMKRAQEAMQSSDIEDPIEGEGTTEEGREQAVQTATGPKAEAGPGPSTSRGPGRGEPDPGAVGND